MARLNLLDLRRVLRDNSNQRLALVRSHLMFEDNPQIHVQYGNSEYAFRFSREGKSLTLLGVEVSNPSWAYPATTKDVDACMDSARGTATLCQQILTQSLAEVGYTVVASSTVPVGVTWAQS